MEQGGVQYLLVGNDGQLTPVGRWSAPVQVVLIFGKYQVKMVEWFMIVVCLHEKDLISPCCRKHPVRWEHPTQTTPPTSRTMWVLIFSVTVQWKEVWEREGHSQLTDNALLRARLNERVWKMSKTPTWILSASQRVFFANSNPQMCRSLTNSSFSRIIDEKLSLMGQPHTISKVTEPLLNTKCVEKRFKTHRWRVVGKSRINVKSFLEKTHYENPSTRHRSQWAGGLRLALSPMRRHYFTPVAIQPPAWKGLAQTGTGTRKILCLWLSLVIERKAKSRRGQCGRGNDGHGVKEVMMVQRDLMSVLMFIEDSTLAASSHAQEVKQQLSSRLLDLELEISSGTLYPDIWNVFWGSHF